MRVGHLHFQNNRRFGASLVVMRSAERVVPFLGISRAVVAWNCA